VGAAGAEDHFVNAFVRAAQLVFEPKRGPYLATRPDVDARETWQALQARLTNARAAVEAGDRPRALAEIRAALDIDPNFLAAHSLREQILALPDVAPSTPVGLSASAPPETSPLSPLDGYAKFEQRARRRRVDRRLDAARAALENGHLKAAAAALDEVIELDQNLPELLVLTARFDDLRRRTAETHRGPQLVACAVFVATVLGASLLHDSTSLISRPMIAAAPLVSVSPTADVAIPPEITAAGTTGDRETVGDPTVLPISLEPSSVQAALVPEVARPPAEPPEVLAPAAPAVEPTPRLLGVQESAVVAPVSTPMPPPAAPPTAPSAALPADDNLLVTQALQRYRNAYEGLDARSAHAVWPAVNQAALARAFDGLESQSLTFDACDVRVRGESATATCQGSARYVPKIGSREPRVEPRVWNFSLHKAGGDWKIDSALAER
jgi:tetratricopeptide (TPR) repeat protein